MCIFVTNERTPDGDIVKMRAAEFARSAALCQVFLTLLGMSQPLGCAYRPKGTVIGMGAPLNLLNLNALILRSTHPPIGVPWYFGDMILVD